MELLAGSEVHGFRTAADLNLIKLLEDASVRWFRPNEVLAILSNHTLFKIQPQPVDSPKSGTILLFDRKMLRNFRKDGHNWKKKKDGKTVQEAHEKLKIGNEEKIHVYYARNEDDPNFYRRCYWLLDKALERIVFVHYRCTSEENEIQQDMSLHDLPATPLNSASSSAVSDSTGVPSGEIFLSEEINSTKTGSNKCEMKNGNELGTFESCLHEINTFEWADLVEDPASTNFLQGNVSSTLPQTQHEPSCMSTDNFIDILGERFSSDQANGVTQANEGCFHRQEVQQVTYMFPLNINSKQGANDLNSDLSNNNEGKNVFSGDHFPSQKVFEQLNYKNDDSFCSFSDLQCATSITDSYPLQAQNEIFNIIDISPSWAHSIQETKVIIIGNFYETHNYLVGSPMYCVFGEKCFAVFMIQVGVYRFTAPPHSPGLVNLFMTLDGATPISQILSFHYRSMADFDSSGSLDSPDIDQKRENYQRQLRLCHSLFSTTNNVSLSSIKPTSTNLSDAKRFMLASSSLMDRDWARLLKSSADDFSFEPYDKLYEMLLRNKLQEWLLSKMAEGCKRPPYDRHGQGIIHLCAMLDYTWAVRLFSMSGISLDFRDAFGWTALHWASYCGREKMVASLLSAGANPSLVTDPTSEIPGGSTAADLASQQGYEGLGAYLAEKGLAAHFEAMTLSGNVSEPPPPVKQMKSDNLYHPNLSEQELLLKESLAAYRNAADAADRIQAAFRERYLKLQTKEVQLVKSKDEAVTIVSAMRIQHAFRRHHQRKIMNAAAMIQGHFRMWKARQEFLKKRKNAIKIQAVFRAHLTRKMYKRIVWSVGVLEKALLRWRLKRKGLRGIQNGEETMKIETEQENTVEEDFYRLSREQAEERMKRSVVRVQAMFRSYQAQKEYRRMKLTHEVAKFQLHEAIGPVQEQ